MVSSCYHPRVYVDSGMYSCDLSVQKDPYNDVKSTTVCKKSLQIGRSLIRMHDHATMLSFSGAASTWIVSW
jgi:hypothetical protein